MKTIYSNTRHPEFIKWSSIVSFVIGLVLVILYCCRVFRSDWANIMIYTAGFTLLYGALFYGQYFLYKLTIDDEADTITDNRRKQYPLKLSEIKTITYKENKNGKFRSLFIHDTGVGFRDIKTSKENADKIVAQILKANPDVQVKQIRSL